MAWCNSQNENVVIIYGPPEILDSRLLTKMLLFDSNYLASLLVW